MRRRINPRGLLALESNDPKTLDQWVKATQARTSPASAADIAALQKSLGFKLSGEYRQFLKKFGRINHGAHETYGLGVPESNYLHVGKATAKLQQQEGYPQAAVPLLSFGDGHTYYLYDNAKSRVVQWASGSAPKSVGGNLASFLAKTIFQGQVALEEHAEEPAEQDVSLAAGDDDSEIEHPSVDDHPVDAAQLAAVDAVETDLAESTDYNAVVQQIEEDTQNAMDVAAALESISSCVGATLPNGGLSKNDAAALRLSVAALSTNVGARPDAIKLPALESFDTVSGRLRSTKLAMESIAEEAKKLWDKIIAAIKAAIKWLSERFQQFWYNAEKISKRADELIAAADASKGEARQSEFSNPELITKLHLGGKLQVLASAKRLEDVCERVYKARPAVLEKMRSNMVGGSLNAKSLFEELIKDLGIANKVSDPKTDGLAVAEGCELVRQAELPGGQALIAQLPTNDDAARPEKMTVVLSPYAPRVKPNTEQQLDVLKPSQVEELALQVKEICKAVLGFKEEISRVNDVKEEIATQAKKLMAAEGKEERFEQQRAAGKIALWMVHLHDQPVSGFTLYALKACVSLLDYGTQSLKQYSSNAEGVASTAGTGEAKKEDGKGDAAPAAA